MSRLAARALTVLPTLGLAVVISPGASFADHTDPSRPLVPLAPANPSEAPIVRGEGTFEHIANFPAPIGKALSGSGTDHKYFRLGDSIYVSTGTLGQGDAGNVGQRIFRLTNGDVVEPEWVADHGSAACTIQNTSITGLQHDVTLLGRTSRRRLALRSSASSRSLPVKAELIVDATDATGRCHDPAGGGLEFIDITGLESEGFQPREIHMIRHAGFSHTVTTDDRKPWILYNSSSDFSGRPWIDVIDAQTCLGLSDLSLAQKRNRCRPSVHRITFEPNWSRQVSESGTLIPGSEATCHDITSRGNRLYCASINATLIFDVSGLTKRDGTVRGGRLPCARINGTRSGASVTDCGGIEASTASNEVPRAAGWRFLGTVNHAGRNCYPAPVTTCNTNTVVPPDEDVAISHEADPVFGGTFMLVTDERGGGVVPPGASCFPGSADQVHGGIHVYDTSDPSNIKPALDRDGEKAVWFGEIVLPAPTFCDVHVIEQMPREQRLAVAYYSQGTKILDFFVDDQKRWSFKETASIVYPNANTWTSDVFKVRTNEDGTKTYYFLATDVSRGVDIFSWTGPSNPIGSDPPMEPAGSRKSSAGESGVLVLGLAASLAVARRLCTRAIAA